MSTEPTSNDRAERAANLFDLRRIIGRLFAVWVVLLIILGATDSDAEANKAAGININLWAGFAMLLFGVLMLLWAFTRPLGAELTEAEESSDEPGRGTRRDRHRPGGEGGSGTKRREHGAAEAAADHAGAGGSLLLQAAHGLLDLGDGGLVVVPQAGVGLVEQPARLLEVVLLQGLGHGVDARVLGDHVPDALAQDAAELAEVVHGGLPQRADVELVARGLALGAVLVVAGCGERMAGAGLDGHEEPVAELQRRRLDVEGAEVDPQRVVGRAEQRREQVHQPGLLAAPLVFDPAAQLRELLQVLRRLGVGQRDQRERERRRERGRGGETAAAREVALDREAGRRERVSGVLELRDHPAHERAPALRGVAVVEREGVALAEVARLGLDAALPERRGDGDAAVDRERQREALVVVGVLADQVHAAGAARGHAHPSLLRITRPASGLSSISR